MERRIIIIALVILAAVCVLWVVMRRRKGSRSGSGLPTTGAPIGARPVGISAQPVYLPAVGDIPAYNPGAYGPTSALGNMDAEGSLPPSLRPKGKQRGVYSRAPGTSIPTITPETVPPYTLGPVPNGITRVPEPPTVRPYEDSSQAVSDDGSYSLFADPAASRASSIGGVNVPAVQNPWDTASWRFLIGTDVNTALNIILNLFPSFPVSTRNVKDGPLMSGAVVLKYDDSGKVVSVIRD